ncbi:MAG: hypothetical protein LH468_09725 [Nocardioides sp.]|nr:hypothetical protein [Nocardioides sp.]
MLPRFEVVARRRPVDLVGVEADVARVGAPYVAVEAVPAGPARLVLTSGGVELVGAWDGERCQLQVLAGGRTTRHRTRRDARAPQPVDGLGLSLTGRHLTVLTRHGAVWTARGRVNLSTRVDTLDETWLAGLAADADGEVGDVRRGTFGQLGLRDLRVVTHTDGTAYREGAEVLLTATSAGPGFFDTAHTSVWSLHLGSLDLRHRSDLFFRRPERPGVYGDHATHLLRDADRWLVATSTWGDFDPRVTGASVAVSLAETGADLLTGQHVLDTRRLALPTTGLRSVGVWDPHLVRSGEGWLVAYVNATRFFRFHPVLATGPDLDHLTVRASTDRVATEGPTLLRLGERWLVAASDGRAGREGQRRAYPVFDLDLQQVTEIEAEYPTNIPWPTLVEVEPGGGDWRMIGFDGTSYGGRLVGYGSHGDVVVQRPVR